MPDGGRPADRGVGHIALGRAVIIVVLAVAVGYAALQAQSSHSSPSAASSATTSTTLPRHVATPTTTTTLPRSQVKVLVANGTQVNGLAGQFTQQLGAQGWSTLTATNAATAVSTSTVYFAPGDQSAAQTIATYLGLKATAVQPLSTATPVTSTGGAAVVVVLGTDLASTSSTG
jgi:hypothetical protein